MNCTKRLLGVPVDHYFDDFDTCTLRGRGAAAQAAVGRLQGLLGFPFSEAKHVPVGEANTFLGVVTDFARFERERVVELYLSDARREKIAGLCASGLKALPPHDAAKLRGSIWWATAWAFGKPGRAAAQPISLRADEHGDDGRVTPEIKRALRYVRDAVRAMPRRQLRVGERRRRPVLVWSDAAWEPEADEPAGGGFDGS